MFGRDIKTRAKSLPVYHKNIKDPALALKRLRASFRKATVKLIIDKTGANLKAIALISEITPKGVYLFCQERLRKRTQITFKTLLPLPLSVRGIVRYCELIDSESPIHAIQEARNYRIFVSFQTSSEMERQAIEDLYLKARDENYVATRWHYYVNELTQSEMRAKHSTMKLQERVKEILDDPNLANEKNLVA